MAISREKLRCYEEKGILVPTQNYVDERTFVEYDFSIFDDIRKGFIFIQNEEIQERELKNKQYP